MALRPLSFFSRSEHSFSMRLISAFSSAVSSSSNSSQLGSQHHVCDLRDREAERLCLCWTLAERLLPHCRWVVRYDSWLRTQRGHHPPPHWIPVVLSFLPGFSQWECRPRRSTIDTGEWETAWSLVVVVPRKGGSGLLDFGWRGSP